MAILAIAKEIVGSIVGYRHICWFNGGIGSGSVNVQRKSGVL